MNEKYSTTEYLTEQINWLRQWALKLAALYLLISYLLDCARFPVVALAEIYTLRTIFMALPIAITLFVFYKIDRLNFKESTMGYLLFFDVILIGIGHAEILSVAEAHQLFFPKIGITIILIYAGLLMALPLKLAFFSSLIIIAYTCWAYLNMGVPQNNVLSYLAFYCLFSSCCLLINMASIRILNSNLRLIKHTNKLASTDELTGLFNRRYFYLEGVKLIKQAIRSQSNYAIVCIDLDNFKPFNDHFGHKFGDEVLVHASEVLSSYCQRPMDFATRMGGDEFILFLYETNQQHIKNICHDIIRELGAQNWQRNGEKISQQLTASIGAVLVTNQNKNFMIMSEVIEEADDLLYAVKNDQKNNFLMKVI